MRTFFHSLLLIAVAFVYVAGPYATAEIEHSHEVSQGHHHHGQQHSGDDRSHHPHEHSPVPSSELPDSEEPGNDSHSHSHIVTLGADTPFVPASHNAFMHNPMCLGHPAAAAELVPDGPSFDLIMPPQLG